MADGPVPSIGYLVRRLAVKWRAELDRALGPLGLTSAQYGVLASLQGLSASGAPPSQRELAEFVGFEPMFVSTLARNLTQIGLMERRAHASDPRALQLRLTPRGLAVLNAARKVVVQLERQRLEALGGHESDRSRALRASLLALLGDVATAARIRSPVTRKRKKVSALPRRAVTRS